MLIRSTFFFCFLLRNAQTADLGSDEMFSACVTSRSSSHRANQQECSPPCLTNFSPRPHNSHQTRFLSCVWRRLIKWYHSGCVLCLEASQAACAALHFCGFPPPCSVLGSVENYKHVATSIAATSRVWVGWDATSKKVWLVTGCQECHLGTSWRLARCVSEHIRHTSRAWW